MADASDTSADSEVYRLTPSTRAVAGGPGLDTLEAGDLRAATRSSGTSGGASGGTLQVTDVGTGQGWSVDFSNIETVVGSPYSDTITANAQITSLSGGGGQVIPVGVQQASLSDGWIVSG